MSSMDLEKLKMTGAGRAVAVLTSGGDAQGDSKKTRPRCQTQFFFAFNTCRDVKRGLGQRVLP